MLNDPQMLEASRVLGSKLVEDQSLSTEDKIALAFRKITCRHADDQEIEILRQGFEEEYARYKANPDEAKKFLHVGAFPQNDKLDPLECAAMMHVVSMIYNLDEVISKS
jgi:hypothetical protein